MNITYMRISVIESTVYVHEAAEVVKKTGEELSFYVFFKVSQNKSLVLKKMQEIKY